MKNTEPLSVTVTTMKTIEPQQAELSNTYKNIGLKLPLRCGSKQCAVSNI